MVDGKPKVIRRNSNCGSGIIHSTFFGVPVRTAAANLDLPKFPPKQVKVLEKYNEVSIMKVSARGREMHCKVANDRTRLAIDREFRCF